MPERTKDTQSPPQTAKPGAAHRRLDVFVGRWEMEGRQFEGPVGAAARVGAVQTYEWLTGGFFLVHRFEGRVGDAEAACIEIIGHDPSSESYFFRSFYNDGKTNEWQARERDGIWTLIGGWPIAGQPTRVRCTIRFGDGGNTMTGKWEYANDGATWSTFWDVKATKAK